MRISKAGHGRFWSQERSTRIYEGVIGNIAFRVLSKVPIMLHTLYAGAHLKTGKVVLQHGVIHFLRRKTGRHGVIAGQGTRVSIGVCIHGTHSHTQYTGTNNSLRQT